MEEPIRILSDIHIGHPGSKITDVRQLAPLIEGAGTVVFNGDTYQQRASPLRAVGDRMFVELGELCAELGARPVFLRGNHDPDLEDAVDHLDLAGGKVFVVHGDILYREISPWGFEVARKRPEIEEIAGRYPEIDRRSLREQIAMTHEIRQLLKPLPFRSLRSGTILGKLRSLANVMWPPQRVALVLYTWMTSHRVAFRALLRWRPEARFIIFGHTHFPIVWTPGDKVVINPGSFFGFSAFQLTEIKDGVLSTYPAQRDPGTGVYRARDTASHRFPLEGSADPPVPRPSNIAPSFGLWD